MTASVKMAGCLLYGERNVIKKIFHLILVTMLAGTAMAQDVSIRADHPDEYVVVKGDTLWDISGKFLEKPWQWPSIWHANPQIENPHLIYPGDRLSLVYIDGRPRLVVNGDKRTVRMSPGIRVSSHEAIPPVEWDAIKNFVTNARVLKLENISDLPYVVANESQRVMATEKDLTYVRGIDGRVGEIFAIVRLRHIYYDDKGEIKRGKKAKYPERLRKDLEYPDNIWNATFSWRTKNPEILGYEFWDVAMGRLVKTGDPAILKIESGRTEVRQGDYVLPVDKHEYPSQVIPHVLNPIPDGLRVLALSQTTYGSGHYQIIAINAGNNQGIEPGHVFSAFRPGKTVRDEVKYPKSSWADAKTWDGDKVTLPDQFSAHILVFRVFDDVSYAIIMDGTRPVREFDVLKHPDETL
ncbi:MAG: LysM peptidoglycan-binding domain-containing protein [Gammaproteobacteria bacterium]|nr:MAG: LysM peptidoglycan-binding domain-containing protein [Gammaproteobacteria bacterium]